MSRFTNRFCITCKSDTMHYVCKCSMCGTVEKIENGQSHYVRGTKKIIARIASKVQGDKNRHYRVADAINYRLNHVRKLKRNHLAGCSHHEYADQNKADKLIAKIRGRKVKGLSKKVTE